MKDRIMEPLDFFRQTLVNLTDNNYIRKRLELYVWDKTFECHRNDEVVNSFHVDDHKIIRSLPRIVVVFNCNNQTDAALREANNEKECLMLIPKEKKTQIEGKPSFWQAFLYGNIFSKIKLFQVSFEYEISYMGETQVINEDEAREIVDLCEQFWTRSLNNKISQSRDDYNSKVLSCTKTWKKQ